MTHVEVESIAELVRDLVRDQHPDLADRPVRLGARGWDNQLWRLGDDLTVRLPWTTGSADTLLRKEYHLGPPAHTALQRLITTIHRPDDRHYVQQTTRSTIRTSGHDRASGRPRLR
jgi:hypothetical protein